MSQRVILTGGGTGGHIVPLLAVAHELKHIDPNCYVIYIGERSGKFASMTAENPDIDEVRTIFAGKFRRYHGESWFVRLFDVKTNVLNLRDLIYFGLGFLQSLWLVRRLKADIILLKGGFVGVPVGLSAALWRTPFITHDSDILPGLANRLVGRWAKLHATGMPADYYNYPRQATRHVGVLVGRQYQTVTAELQADYRLQLNIPVDSHVLLVTGGSGGAAAINGAVRAIVPELLAKYPTLRVIHQVGKGKAGVYNDYQNDRLQVFELMKSMHVYTGASDLVITRAGANTMAELGVQGKACVVVPNPLLTGGHQLKNAEIWAAQGSAAIVSEAELRQDTSQLFQVVCDLLDDESRRQTLGRTLQENTVKDAAPRLAELLLHGDANSVRS